MAMFLIFYYKYWMMDGLQMDKDRTVDFRNTVIVMTSNLGSHLIQEMTGSPL